MKKRVLLIDESLTVQKVVALTLDRNKYNISYARTRAEAAKGIVDSAPDLIMVSDQVTDITIPSFPKEVEAWLARVGQAPPPILLITGQDVREARHYAGVLKKPFSPQTLQGLIHKHTEGVPRAMPRPQAPPPPAPEPVYEGPSSAAEMGTQNDEYEDQRLQKIFNDAFADETKLTNETLKAEEERLHAPPQAPRGGGDDLSWEERPTRVAPQKPAAPPSTGRAASPSDLWNVTPPGQSPRQAPPPKAPAHEVLTSEDSMAYKAVLENQVETKLEGQDLEEIVDKLLTKIVPPIVERIVNERLDKLLKEQEQFIELKA